MRMRLQLSDRRPRELVPAAVQVFSESRFFVWATVGSSEELHGITFFSAKFHLDFHIDETYFEVFSVLYFDTVLNFVIALPTTSGSLKVSTALIQLTDSVGQHNVGTLNKSRKVSFLKVIVT